jgi:two-component system, NtrC family, response regulator AtoC
MRATRCGPCCTGAVQRTAPPTYTEPVTGGRRTLLVTHRGRTSAFELPEQGELVIGRSQSCEVFLDDQQVSRRHAVLHVQPSGVQLEDLGSHNGTLLLGASETLSAMRAWSDETQTGSAYELRLAPNVRTPLSDDALVQIGSALLTIQVSTARRRLKSEVGIPGFVVVDGAMQRLLDLADRAAPTTLTVLLLGESGSGKEMLARYVHQRSPRAAKRMVSLNCGALPEHLIESELFGHEKGAFTGAAAAKPGLFEAAEGSTLFLDEVGELTLGLQVKLLRVLEDRQVLRVGALEPRHVDVRFVAATNRDLEAQVAAGKFREDLYYRLYGIALHLPSLRERRDDILALADRFLDDLPEPGQPRPTLTDAARAKLHDYDWPGNVRELKNVIHRALVMADGPRIDADDLELARRDSRSGAAIPAMLDEAPDQLRARAEGVEKKRILDALEQCAGNQTRAAELLGITRRVLVRRLEKFNLPRPRRDSRLGDDDESV